VAFCLSGPFLQSSRTDRLQGGRPHDLWGCRQRRDWRLCPGGSTVHDM